MYWRLAPKWEQAGNNALVWADLDDKGLRQAFRKADLSGENGVLYEAMKNDIGKARNYLVESLDYGWIDPHGNFWGCDRAGHDRLLGVFFGIDDLDAERAGWVRVYAQKWRCGFRRHPNDYQEQTLIDIGRSSDHVENDYRDAGIKFADVFPEGHPLHLLPEGRFRRIRETENVRARRIDG